MFKGLRCKLGGEEEGENSRVEVQINFQMFLS